MSRTGRHAALLAIGALLAVPIAGCGGDDDDEGGEANPASRPAPSGGTATGAGGPPVDLSATEFAFNPSDPTAKGGTVTFNVTNDGQTTHALEVEGPGEEQETEDIAPGGSAKLTVDLNEPGTYEFYCPIGNHRELGMEGEVTVK